MSLRHFLSKNKYNLLVVNDQDAWEKKNYYFDSNRFGEYSDGKFDSAKFTNETATELSKYPCLFLYEEKTKKNGYLGYITKIHQENKKLKLSFKIEHKIQMEIILTLKDKLNIISSPNFDTELERTHWAVKDVNLLKILRTKDSELKESLYDPKVFLSWSKSKSKRLAESFKQLLCSTLGLHSHEIFISSEDIDLGQDWWQAISSSIKVTKIGIIFVTRDNFESPWINYETGLLQDQLKTTGQVLLVSTMEDFNKIDSSSPLRKFQFTKNIYDKDSAYKLIEYIAKKLEFDQDDLDCMSAVWNQSDNWQNFYRTFISPIDEEFINFKNMLSFWIPKVVDAWKPENEDSGFQFSEIMPKSPMIRSDLTNVDNVSVSDRDFQPDFLSLDADNQITLKFSQDGRLKFTQDTCITWIPQNENQSWFLKIIYNNNKNTLEVKYLATASSENNDTDAFKNYMKEYSQPKPFLISKLGLNQPDVNNNVKNLFNSFVAMIDYSKKKSNQ